MAQENRQGLSPQELDQQSIVELPDREAMSVISTMPVESSTIVTDGIGIGTVDGTNGPPAGDGGGPVQGTSDTVDPLS